MSFPRSSSQHFEQDRRSKAAEDEQIKKLALQVLGLTCDRDCHDGIVRLKYDPQEAMEKMVLESVEPNADLLLAFVKHFYTIEPPPSKVLAKVFERADAICKFQLLGAESERASKRLSLEEGEKLYMCWKWCETQWSRSPEASRSPRLLKIKLLMSSINEDCPPTPLKQLRTKGPCNSPLASMPLDVPPMPGVIVPHVTEVPGVVVPNTPAAVVPHVTEVPGVVVPPVPAVVVPHETEVIDIDDDKLEPHDKLEPLWSQSVPDDWQPSAELIATMREELVEIQKAAQEAQERFGTFDPATHRARAGKTKKRRNMNAKSSSCNELQKFDLQEGKGGVLMRQGNFIFIKKLERKKWFYQLRDGKKAHVMIYQARMVGCSEADIRRICTLLMHRAAAGDSKKKLRSIRDMAYTMAEKGTFNNLKLCKDW